MPEATVAETTTESTEATNTAAAATSTETAAVAASETATTEAAVAAPVVPTVPEKYDLKVPEGTPFTADALERTAALARTLGLSDDAKAQSVVDFLATELKGHEANILKAYQPGGTAWTQMVDGWRAEALADASLGKTPEERKAAIGRGESIVKEYAKQHPKDAEAMTSFLNDSGLGDHPAAVRFFAWLGKAASESAPVQPGAQGGGSEEAFRKRYPSMANT